MYDEPPICLSYPRPVAAQPFSGGKKRDALGWKLRLSNDQLTPFGQFAGERVEAIAL
jgi:hypothetical protein